MHEDFFALFLHNIFVCHDFLLYLQAKRHNRTKRFYGCVVLRLYGYLPRLIVTSVKPYNLITETENFITETEQVINLQKLNQYDYSLFLTDSPFAVTIQRLGIHLPSVLRTEHG